MELAPIFRLLSYAPTYAPIEGGSTRFQGTALEGYSSTDLRIKQLVDARSAARAAFENARANKLRDQVFVHLCGICCLCACVFLRHAVYLCKKKSVSLCMRARREM